MGQVKLAGIESFKDRDREKRGEMRVFQVLGKFFLAVLSLYQICFFK